MSVCFQISQKAKVLSLVFLSIICATPLRADEVQYFPDGLKVMASADFAVFKKTKLFGEVKKQLKDFESHLNDRWLEQFGVPAENMARLIFILTVTEKGEQSEFAIVTTQKPVTAAEIKAKKKVRPILVDHKFEEIKVGKYFVYEESYQYNAESEPVRKGSSFCVVEDKVVLIGTMDVLKPVIKRNAKPNLSPALASELAQGGLSSPYIAFTDVSRIPKGEMKQLQGELNGVLPGAGDLLDKVESLAIRANETSKLNVKATVACKDAATAAETKKIAEAGIGLLQGLGKNNDLPLEARTLIKSANDILSNVKLTVNGKQATAEVTIDSVLSARLIANMRDSFAPPKKSESKFEFKKDDSKKDK